MKFLKDESGFGAIVYGAVALVVFIILITSVVMPTIVNTALTYPTYPYGNATAVLVPWPAATIAMWGIIPIVVIASVILFVIGKK